MTEDITFLDTQQAARMLGLSAKTLARYRVTGEGPVFHRFGNRIRYLAPFDEDEARRFLAEEYPGVQVHALLQHLRNRELAARVQQSPGAPHVRGGRTGRRRASRNPRGTPGARLPRDGRAGPRTAIVPWPGVRKDRSATGYAKRGCVRNRNQLDMNAKRRQ